MSSYFAKADRSSEDTRNAYLGAAGMICKKKKMLFQSFICCIFRILLRFCIFGCLVFCVTCSLSVGWSEIRHDGKDSDDRCYLPEGTLIYDTSLRTV